MKRIAALLISLAVAFSVCACGGSAEESSAAAGADIQTSDTAPGGAVFNYSLEEALQAIDKSSSLQEMTGLENPLGSGTFEDKTSTGTKDGCAYTIHAYPITDNFGIVVYIEDASQKTLEIDFISSSEDTSNDVRRYQASIFEDVAKEIGKTTFTDTMIENIVNQNEQDYNDAAANGQEYDPVFYFDGNTGYKLYAYQSDSQSIMYCLVAFDGTRVKDDVRKVQDYQ